VFVLAVVLELLLVFLGREVRRVDVPVVQQGEEGVVGVVDAVDGDVGESFAVNAEVVVAHPPVVLLHDRRQDWVG
jgi:hypothetical protein